MILRAAGHGVVWGSIGGAVYTVLMGLGAGVLEGRLDAAGGLAPAIGFFGAVTGGILGLAVGLLVGVVLAVVFGSPHDLRLYSSMARPARFFGMLAVALFFGVMSAAILVTAGLGEPLAWGLFVIGPWAVATFFAYRKSPEIIGLPAAARRPQRVWWTTRDPVRA